MRISAGSDPSTGERIVLYETVPIAPGRTKSEKAKAGREAYKEAVRVQTRLQAEADALKVGKMKATVSALLDKWMPQHEIDATTRMNYESQIRRYIKPRLGEVPVILLARDASERLEGFYAHLRRCEDLCDGRPFMEHRVSGLHDCDALECRPHRCEPYAASSVRSIHAILSGAFSAAVRWGWVTFNPMPSVKPPSKKRPQPRPPTAEQMARIVEAAFSASNEWGLYIWLSAVTGARRGEVLALQWNDIDFEARKLGLDANYVRAANGMIIKDTKSHQMRLLSVDEPTMDLLVKHREECEARMAQLGMRLAGDAWVFSAKPDFSTPRDPSSMTRRYSRLAAKIGIETQLKELRHYSATELLTAGVDLRTVAGRLGHSDGTTTLRHYAAWVNSADQAAAATIGATMPARPSGLVNNS